MLFRSSLSAWEADEFAQVVKFGKGLVSPDGEPKGWVIDGDVQLGWTRFHPATPDAACWTMLLAMMNDRLNGDAIGRPLVARILERYAGLTADGIKPSRTADGIFRHWIDPANGGVKSGWDPEFSTMSTMLIVTAAARAAAFYPTDLSIQGSARAIICGVHNWDAYFNPTTRAMYLKGLLGGGPDTSTGSGPYHEGLIFVEQAAAYGEIGRAHV